MIESNLQQNIDIILNGIGRKSPIITRKIIIGKETKLEAVIIYVNGLVDKNIIDRDILNPLMLHVNEELTINDSLGEYLSKCYIPMSNTVVEKDINNVIAEIKNGKTTILINNYTDFILVDTSGGSYRQISEPISEYSIKGSREGLVENLETNISMIRRKIKDSKLVFETIKMGRRSQTELSIIYIDDIADKKVVNRVIERVSAIDVDYVNEISIVAQYIEGYPYSIFPQAFLTERPDVVSGNLLEGRICIIMNGVPRAMLVPCLFTEFFQTADDYSERTIIASYIRLLRLTAVFIVVFLPSIYLTLIKFDAELIPISFISPIIKSRIGIALTPLMEILSMELTIEMIREGGLRLPTKLSQTLSVVGGIIIGDTAVKSKIVSPTTLLIIAIVTIATFLIPNYDMSLTIRFLRIVMLFITNILGILGLAGICFFLLVHLLSLENYGVGYFDLKLNDMKDIFVRVPLWKMNTRPEAIPNSNRKRQTDFRSKFRRK